MMRGVAGAGGRAAGFVVCVVAVSMLAACEGAPSATGPTPRGGAPAVGHGAAGAPPTAETPANPSPGEAPPRELEPPVPTATPASIAEPDPGSATGRVTAKVPDRGCVALPARPVLVTRARVPAAVRAAGDGFLVATVEQDAGGEAVVLRRAGPGRPLTLLAKRALPTGPSRNAARPMAVAPPALLVEGPRWATATVDGRGNVLVTQGPAASPWVTVGERADERFSPALTWLDAGCAVAWTEVHGGATRPWLTVVSGSGEPQRQNIAPPGMGGAAPAWLEGSRERVLYFVDPREGTTPVVRLPVDGRGAPGEPVVLRTVGTAPALPELAAARLAEDEVIAYTAVGNAATTAVGFFTVKTKDYAPQAVVPGKGYGLLHVAALAGPKRVVVAADAPLDTPPTAPRLVHLRTVDPAGLGPVLEVKGKGGHATNPALARLADGTLALAFTDEDGTHLHFLACDD